ncbi:MAG: hypothetical protein HYR94_10840 [Chloroflexi bacterium]|nr:hypothetical protein [Chloroflexota bacterium]
MRHPHLCLFLPIVLFILTSCGYSRPPDQPDFQAIQPDSTSTSQAASNQTPAEKPTSISYPENWQFFERPDGVVFIDPGDYAGYGVFFSDPGQVYTEQELNQYLVTFVAKNFVDKDANFKPISQETRADGSIVAQFSSLDPNLGQAVNEIRVSQQDTIVFALYLSATEAQWQASENQLHRLADTLTLMDTTPITTTSPTAEPLEWVLIGPTGAAFGFLHPSDWKILRQGESSVAVGMPETDLVFEANVADLPETQDQAGAAKKAAQKYIDTLRKDYEDVQARPPEKFQLDQVTDGATIDFVYTAADGSGKAGSIITAASDGKLYQVVFSSSAGAYEAALQWFNPMYKSFKILPAEDLIQEP